MRYVDKEYTLDIDPITLPYSSEVYRFEAALLLSSWGSRSSKQPLCTTTAKTALYCVYHLIDTLMDESIPFLHSDRQGALEWLRDIQIKLEGSSTNGRCYKRGPLYPL